MKLDDENFLCSATVSRFRLWTPMGAAYGPNPLSLTPLEVDIPSVKILKGHDCKYQSYHQIVKQLYGNHLSSEISVFQFKLRSRAHSSLPPQLPPPPPSTFNSSFSPCSFFTFSTFAFTPHPPGSFCDWVWHNSTCDCYSAELFNITTCWWIFSRWYPHFQKENIGCLGKYDLRFGQIRLIIWTTIFVIWTISLSNFNKYIL